MCRGLKYIHIGFSYYLFLASELLGFKFYKVRSPTPWTFGKNRAGSVVISGIFARFQGDTLDSKRLQSYRRIE